jgi:hypothetical protein
MPLSLSRQGDRRTYSIALCLGAKACCERRVRLREREQLLGFWAHLSPAPGNSCPQRQLVELLERQRAELDLDRLARPRVSLVGAARGIAEPGIRYRPG